MKLLRARAGRALLIVLLGARTGKSAESSEAPLGALASSARAAVVEVLVVRSTPHHTGRGTGFFVSRDGQVLTDLHVVSDATMITNTEGRVVGIANGKYISNTPDQEENYAVPAGDIRRLLAQQHLMAYRPPESSE